MSAAARTRVPTVSARLALPLVAEWRRRGRDPVALLDPLGLDEDALHFIDGRIALHVWSSLHASCVDESDDVAFPLEGLARIERDAFPIGLHLVSSQRTVADGLRFVEPYMRSVADGLTIEVVPRGERSFAQFRRDGEALGPPAFAEYLLATLWAFVRHIAPGSVPPLAVRFTHRWARHGRALGDFFGAPVRFGATQVGFEFDLPNLDVPIPSADPELGRVLASSAATLMAAAGSGEVRLRDRARHWLAEHLVGDAPLATRLGRAMRLSERSLRRKLSDEGTSLRDLVDEVRHERAIALLEQGRFSLDRVAVELGFSSASAFGRAFRKWTGTPPADFVRARGQNLR